MDEGENNCRWKTHEGTKLNRMGQGGRKDEDSLQRWHLRSAKLLALGIWAGTCPTETREESRASKVNNTVRERRG